MEKSHARLRRRPFYFPLVLPILAFLAAALSISWFLTSQSTTTVLLVRHAEKVEEGGNDPRLSPDGELRARTLAQIAGQAGVSTIYATQYERTQATARPLADRLGLEVEIVAADDPEKLHDRVMSRHRGEVVLVVGHSNTVPDLVRMFGGNDVPPMSDDEYANLYIVSIPWFGERKILRLAYGESG